MRGKHAVRADRRKEAEDAAREIDSLRREHETFLKQTEKTIMDLQSRCRQLTVRNRLLERQTVEGASDQTAKLEAQLRAKSDEKPRERRKERQARKTGERAVQWILNGLYAHGMGEVEAWEFLALHLGGGVRSNDGRGWFVTRLDEAKSDERFTRMHDVQVARRERLERSDEPVWEPRLMLLTPDLIAAHDAQLLGEDDPE